MIFSEESVYDFQYMHMYFVRIIINTVIKAGGIVCCKMFR